MVADRVGSRLLGSNPVNCAGFQRGERQQQHNTQRSRFHPVSVFALCDMIALVIVAFVVAERATDRTSAAAGRRPTWCRRPAR